MRTPTTFCVSAFEEVLPLIKTRKTGERVFRIGCVFVCLFEASGFGPALPCVVDRFAA